MVVGAVVELVPVEEGISGDAPEGGAPGAFPVALGVPSVPSVSSLLIVVVLGSDEAGFCRVEVLLFSSAPVGAELGGGGAPADFEAVPGVSGGAPAGLTPLVSK